MLTFRLCLKLTLRYLSTHIKYGLCSLIVLLVIGGNNLWALCTALRATASIDTIVCGNCLELSVVGLGGAIFTDDFNGGIATGWNNVPTADFTNPCSPSGVDGTTHLWMGDQAGAQRDLETPNLDLSQGGTICFDLKYAFIYKGVPCDGPETASEGVAIQYSIDNGTTWIDIDVIDPQFGFNKYVKWRNKCYIIPAGAQTANTMVRWSQTPGQPDNDNWGIDNVEIRLPANNTMTWEHDGFGHPPEGGTNPNLVCPRNDTSYVVSLDGGLLCTDTVKITVQEPQITLFAGNDTTFCVGDCGVLNTDIKVVIDSAKSATFFSDDTDAKLNFVFGTVLNDKDHIDLEVSGLNRQTVTPGSIEKVCVTMSTTVGTPVTSLDVLLECPNGSSIKLYQEGTLPSGGFFNLANPSEFINTCFSPTSTLDITTGSKPYTGDWIPFESFDNLATAGCPTEGNWRVVVGGISGFNSATGNIQTVDITIRDEEVSYIPNISWSPSTEFMNQADTSSPNPTICPVTPSVTYTVTASDTSGCVSKTDDVVISVMPCCQLKIDSIVTQNPSCSNDGSIEIFTSGQITNLVYSIDSGQTTQTTSLFNNLGPDTYNIYLNDDNNCEVFQVVTLTSSSSLTLNTVDVTPSACTNPTGTITIDAASTLGGLMYSVDSGITPQVSNVFMMLAPGNYNVWVSDAGSCEQVQLTTIATLTGPKIDSVQIISPTCGDANGNIEFYVSGGTAPLAYSIDSGSTNQTTNVFANILDGSYNLIVADAGGCFDDTVIVLTNTPPIALNLTVRNAGLNCNYGCNGHAIALPSGGTVSNNYQLNWSANITDLSGDTAINLCEGVYSVSVTDDVGCIKDTTFSVQQFSPLSVDDAVIEDASCEEKCNGSISFTSGAISSLSMDSGITAIPSSQVSNLCDSVYTILITDTLGCDSFVTITINNKPSFSANFSYQQRADTNPFDPVIDFTNHTAEAAFFYWNFAGLDSSIQENPQFTFIGGAGNTYNVCLTAKDSAGCNASICVEVETESNNTFYAPNAITVNNDGINDGFIPKFFGWENPDYRMRIFNRWGDLIFETNKVTEPWNGKVAGSNKLVEEGIYLWEIELDQEGVTKQLYRGHLTVIINR